MRIQLSSILFSQKLKRFAKIEQCLFLIFFLILEKFILHKKTFMQRCTEFANILNYYKNFSVVISKTVNSNRLKKNHKNSYGTSNNSCKQQEFLPPTTEFENCQPKPFLLFKETSLLFLSTSFNNFLGQKIYVQIVQILFHRISRHNTTELEFNSQCLNESSQSQ